MHDCITRERKALMNESEAINYVKFDLSSIVDLNNPKENKTGQRIWIGYKKKNKQGVEIQREQKTFITHKYCPFCGKKYK